MFLKSMSAPSILPATAVLELTSRCNHACLFCSCPWYDDGVAQQRRHNEMPAAEWKDLISTYAAAGVMNFCFTGGEPLLKDGLHGLIAFAANTQARHIETVGGELKAWDAPPKLFLLSNGKILDDATLALCARHDIALSISLPGLETFDEHTRGGQPVEHVLELFRKAKSMNISTTAGITVTAKNFHELRDTIAFALIAGADRILLNRFMPGGRGLANRELELSVAQIRAIPDIAEEVLAKANRHGHIGTEYPRCLVDPARYEFLRVGTRCSAATDFFVVGPSGMLRVCNHSPVDLVHWRDYDTLRNHPYWRKFIRKDWTPQGCEGCALLGRECDGGCREAAHVANGSPDAPDPVFRGESPDRKQAK
ncbi:MAG: radical SAM protein [Kiritimatiellaeota bacterium]|nr:radical SAM protein [Kiritimatiellota bacterium]